jgi:dTDP-4-amino-4,6-dideoxygalactose transaminase
MIALNDLQRHTAAVAGEVAAAMSRVSASGWFINGNELAAFEREFAQYCGTAFCVGVANGTDALELALRCVGVAAGSRVATVANAGGYASTAIRAIGAQPVYVDIDPRTLCMDPRALAAADLAGVKAVVPVHLYGVLANVEEIGRIAARHGIPVIEDCAQAHGAIRGTKRAGSFGTLGCFSFYPTKNLGAMGDGGAIVGADPAHAERLRQLRQYGWSSKYVSSVGGGRNSRLDEIQAAILRAKLGHLDAWNERRRAIAARYVERIRHPEVQVHRDPGAGDVAHLFVVRSARRDALARHCRERGIGTDIHYPVADHLQPMLGGAGTGLALAETVRACAEVLTLPCFPEMQDAEVDAVTEAVNSWRP